VGTATTFAGLVDANENETEIIGFGVLKNFNDIEKRFEDLTHIAVILVSIAAVVEFQFF
jgi:1-aminocyclopropane-1-carboxylate deaminase/D-cysteine desulfhydrase-like pyridoxal-dependent ACC family enzyme